MTSPLETLLLLAPDFSLILLGLLLRQFSGQDRPLGKAIGLNLGTAFWAGTEQLVYWVLFPALLFLAAAQAPLPANSAFGLIASGWSVVISGAILVGILQKFAKIPALDLRSGAQCGFRFNSYIALALAERVLGGEGLAVMGLLIGVCVPLANLLAVLFFTGIGGKGWLKGIAQNPLISATLLGLACNLAGWTLDPVLVATLKRLGQAAVSIGLLCVGAGLVFSREHLPPIQNGIVHGIKLFGLPALVFWGLPTLADGHIWTANPNQAATLLLFAGLPTATSAYVLASRMGGNAPLVAQLVSLSTLLSAFSYLIWLPHVQHWQNHF
jgi:malonate transporter and related proteins